MRSDNADPTESMDPDGFISEYLPPSAHTSSHSSTTRLQTGGENPLRPSPVILRISPANDGDIAGYIHLAPNEFMHRSALVAYFNKAGRAVDVIPCPDFDAFLAEHSLRMQNVSFLMDLPEFILESGRRLLKTIDESSNKVCPDLSWLPTSTSPVATFTSSQPLLSQRHIHLPSSPANVHMPNLQANLTTQTRHRPDPDGIDPQHAPRYAPLSFSMGGNISVGNFSPLTTSDVVTSDVGTFHSIQGSSTPRDYTLTQRSSSVTAPPSSSGVLVMSSFLGSMIPKSSQSSDSSTKISSSPPPAAPQSMALIKDKPSDLGIKNITDKESWTEAKKIINARLRRPPYWPGESKSLVTTNLNDAASVWWEEVIYCLLLQTPCF